MVAGRATGVSSPSEDEGSIEFERDEAERAPPAFLILLIGGSLMIAFLIGFTCAGEGHGRLVPVGYVLLAGCTIVTILDLNDPWHGFLRPSNQNYAQLLKAIERP